MREQWRLFRLVFIRKQCTCRSKPNRKALEEDEHAVDCASSGYSRKGPLFWQSVVVAARDLFKGKSVGRWQIDLLCSDRMTWDPFLLCLFEGLCFVCRGIQNVPRTVFQLFMELSQMKTGPNAADQDHRRFDLVYPVARLPRYMNEELVHWSLFITHMYLTSEICKFEVEDWTVLNRFKVLKLLHCHTHSDSFTEAMPSLTRPFRFQMMDFGMLQLSTLVLANYVPAETPLFDDLKWFPVLANVIILIESNVFETECIELIEQAGLYGFHLDASVDVESLLAISADQSLLTKRIHDMTSNIENLAHTDDSKSVCTWVVNGVEKESESRFYGAIRYKDVNRDDSVGRTRCAASTCDVKLCFNRKVSSDNGMIIPVAENPAKKQCIQPRVKKAQTKPFIMKPIKLLQ